MVIINASVHERQLRSARHGPTSLVYLYGVIAVPTPEAEDSFKGISNDRIRAIIFLSGQLNRRFPTSNIGTRIQHFCLQVQGFKLLGQLGSVQLKFNSTSFDESDIRVHIVTQSYFSQAIRSPVSIFHVSKFRAGADNLQERD